jgi:pSer/pThr/pTyr-binding forkhead associated (FHA) protein
MIPARITLTLAQNEREFVFEEPAECVIGRAADCDIQIPADEEHADVSRHHCVLEIHPPHIQVRDLGSTNGTFVNGRLVGQRPPHQPAEESGLWPSSARALNNGDELRIGNTIFHVVVHAPLGALTAQFAG